MTQTPQLPIQLPPEPLDATERELARALRNLPSGSPPAELDARILGAARRAVHLAQPRKPDRRWLVGLGTAAGCLLAIAVMWKTREPAGHDFYAPPVSAPASERAAPANTPAAAQSPEPPPLEAARPESKTAADAEVAPAEVAESAKPQGSLPATQQAPGAGDMAGQNSPNAFPATIKPAPAPPALQEAPPPPSPPVVIEQTTPMSVPAPPPAPTPEMAAAPPTPERAARQSESMVAPRADSAAKAAVAAAPEAAGAPANDKKLSKDEPRDASAKPSAAAAAGSLDTADAEKAKNLDSITVVGTRVRRVDTETASPVVVVSPPNDEMSAVPPTTNSSTSLNSAGEGKAKSLDTIPAGGAATQGLDRETDVIRLPIDDDARLSASQWTERIRARVKAEDDLGARESLRRFRARYSHAPIPDDLQDLQPTTRSQ